MKNIYSRIACGGMDVHYKFSNITFRNSSGDIVRRQRLKHPQRKELFEQFSLWPKGIPVVMEASFGWGWLSELMELAGLDVKLSNCYKIEQMRKARGWVKTNKRDADLTSVLPFELTEWWRVWRARREVRNRREQMRFRGDLVELQTMVKNRIHAIFHRHGIFHEFSDLFGGQGRKFLSELCLNGSEYLPSEALLALRGQVKLLSHIRKQLADVGRILQRHLQRTPLIRRLKTISGIGLIISNILVAEMGTIERFRNHKALASYSLLAPRCKDSGQEDMGHSPLGRHLGDRGNRTPPFSRGQACPCEGRGGRLSRLHMERFAPAADGVPCLTE